jgi:hypothetical protein
LGIVGNNGKTGLISSSSTTCHVVFRYAAACYHEMFRRVAAMQISTIGSLATILASLLFAGSVSAQSCPDVPAEHEAVVNTLRTFYAGATKDDYVVFGSVLAPDFYALDNGRRFDGVSVLDFVKTEYQDKGYVFVWNVADPTVRTACNTAWITYTNIGSSADPSGKVTPMK